MWCAEGDIRGLVKHWHRDFSDFKKFFKRFLNKVYLNFEQFVKKIKDLVLE